MKLRTDRCSLADSLAEAGYFVVMPDLFRGDPVPENALSNPNSGFNMTAWRARHPQSQVESIIESAISTLRNQFGTTKLAGVVSCSIISRTPLTFLGLLLWWKIRRKIPG